jgi:hypothetical protein
VTRRLFSSDRSGRLPRVKPGLVRLLEWELDEHLEKVMSRQDLTAGRAASFGTNASVIGGGQA